MFKKEETASHYVDPQKGFTPLCPDELPVLDGDKIVPALLEQLKHSKIKTCSKDAHNRKAIWVANEDQKQFDLVEGENVDICWNAHCIVGEKGFDLLDGIPKVTEYDFFIWKGVEPHMHPYSSCYHDLTKTISTGLIEYYKQNEIKNIIVSGLALDFCIKETCIDLKEAGFNVLLNLEGCRGVAEQSILDALNEMETSGVILVDKVKDLYSYFQ